MAGFQGGGDEDIIAAINVTPLVDIILVLLIIFMVTTSYVVNWQINVDLPKAASGQSEVKETVVFQVRADGTYLMDGEPTALESIGAQAETLSEQNPELRAVIAADKKVDYGRVVDLIDTIKTNGLTKFALNIQKKKKKQAE
jgi:biopolymer transport protein ExbD